MGAPENNLKSDRKNYCEKKLTKNISLLAVYEVEDLS